MSYSTYFRPIQKTAYSYVGGVNDKQDVADDKKYIKNQTDVIKDQKQLESGGIPDYINKTSHGNIIGSLRYGLTLQNEKDTSAPPDNYHRFNPYYNYLYNEGLFNENAKTRINTSTYTVNSSMRSLLPTITSSLEMNLSNNPLSFTSVDVSIGVSDTKQNILTINAPGHGIKKNDRIMLSGLDKTTISIKNIYQDINGETKSAIAFTQFSTSAVFFCNFDTVKKDPIGQPTSIIDTSMSFDPNFRIGNGLNFSDLKSYDTSDMFVTISGFDISQLGEPFYGNIPIAFLNSTHQIYFTNPDYKVVNGINVYTPDTLINVPDSNGVVKKITGFYIKLPKPYHGIQSTNTMTLSLTFNYFGGIPINIINAQFPIDENNLNGYHEVNSVTDDTISILLSKNTHYRNSTGGGITETQATFGGDNIYISRIDDMTSGYSNPNNYVVELPNIIRNVVMIKMTSLSFPNTSKVFTNAPETKNTRLYWQNQDDGDFIYNIEIDPGNYSPSDLEKLIHSKVYEVQRKYSKISNLSTSYTNKNYMTVSIDTNTNKVTFSSFKEAALIKPIQDISPEIAAVGDGNPPYTLTISQSAHGLLPGNSVTFTGFVATSGIPTEVLNATHTVVSVPTSDTYTIVLDNFNLLAGTRNDTGGGYAGKALVPSAFKLLFNYPDTMGTQLGFRKVGQDVATTKFDTVITNYDSYENETVMTDTNGTKYVLDESGGKITLQGQSLKLSGYDYAIMVIRDLNNIINLSDTKTIKTCFAKVNLRGLPGTISYDDFICPPLTLYEPINLSSLEVSFYSPDGLLYDFNGLDHNFTIEITFVEYIPGETGIVSTLATF